jgi:two-component system CheB/CheR fusion protein
MDITALLYTKLPPYMDDQLDPFEADADLTGRIDTGFALAAAGLGLWEINPLTTLLRWDKRCQDLFCLRTPEPLPYQAGLEKLHAEDIDRVREVLGEAVNCQTGSSIDLICRTIRSADQQVRWIRLTGRSYHTQTGECYRLAGIAHEMTQQVEAQHRAQQTAQQLQTLLDSSPAVVGFLTPLLGPHREVVSFELVVGNQQLAQLSQKPIAQLLHQPFTQFSHILWQEQTFANLQHVFLTGEPFYQEQVEPTPQGERWFSLSVTRWDTGLVLTGLDITDLKESQRLLQQGLSGSEATPESRAILEASRAMLRQRGELLRAASHDVRGNLHILAGVIGLLELTSPPNPRPTPILELMRRNVRQAAQVLTNLSDYVRLEEGLEGLTLTEVEVSGLLGGLLTSLKPIALEKGLLISAQGLDRLRVEGDALNLKRLLHNVLLTTLRHTEESPLKVSWGVEADANEWWCRLGIVGYDRPSAVDWLERLAGVPVRATPADQAPRPGDSATRQDTRRGRSTEDIEVRLVQQLVSLLGATLRVEHQPAGETTLLIRFPLSYRAVK